MKFMKMTVALVLAMGLGGVAQAAVSSAKVAELGMHRLERLVELRKIEDGFVDNFYALRLERLQAGSPGEAAFRFRGYQTQGTDGSSRQVAILIDESGKALSQEVIEGSVGASPDWKQKDPVTLMEMALHHVIDGAGNADIAPFAAALTEGSLSQVTLAPQGTVVRAVFKSSSSAKVLEVLLKLNGAFIRAEVK